MPTEKVHAYQDRSERDELFKERTIETRYVLAFMCFYCFVCVDALRSNVSITLVAMVNWTQVKGNSYNECEYPDKHVRKVSEDGPFKWSPVIQGHILACYFYGIALTHILGWILSEKCNEKLILLFGTMIATLMNFLIPVYADSDGYIVMLLQVLKGCGHGLLFPAFSCLEAKWVPPAHRPGFVAFVASGMPIGGFFNVVICAIACVNFGWLYGFYIPGIVATIWCLSWVLMMVDSPLTFPFQTDEEHESIETLQIETVPMGKIPVPLRSILSTAAVWAFIFAGFACYWVLFFHVALVPLLLGPVLKFDLQTNGLMSAIPRLTEALTLVSSILGEMKKRIRNATTMRKVCVGTGLFGVSFCMLTLTFTGCNRTFCVLLLVLGLGLSGFSFFAVAMVPIDMSPRFSSTLNGVMKTVGALAGAGVTTLLGYLTENSQTIYEWHLLFYINAGICTIAAILFICLGSGELQKWNNHPLTPEFGSSADDSKVNSISEPAPPPDVSSETPPDGPPETPPDAPPDKLKNERPWSTTSFLKLPDKPDPPVTLGKIN